MANRMTVVSLSIALFAFVVWYYCCSSDELPNKTRPKYGGYIGGSLRIDYGERSIIITNADQREVVYIRLKSSSAEFRSSQCDANSLSSHEHCELFDDVLVTWNKKIHDLAECYDIEYQAVLPGASLVNCIDLKEAHWYGGSGFFDQRWPIEAKIPMQPYLSSDVGLDDKSTSKFGSILERYWVNSQGVGVHLDYQIPLHVSINNDNDDMLCLKSDGSVPPYQNSADKDESLRYRVCISDNVKKVHQFMAGQYFDKPYDIPDERMFRSPVWSTWARYKMNINQTIVVNYAREIRKHGFSNSQLEIDDKWSTTYGDMEFDTNKFPKAALMVSTLQQLGFRVTAWVTPFANVDSKAYEVGSRKGYWVKDASGKKPALIKWWQGEGALLDVTNHNAIQWYVDRLRELRHDVRLSSYKFDAGEINFLPPSCITQTPLLHPGQYTTNYVKTAASLGDQIEVRAGQQTQSRPIFVRMFDKFSKWGYDNGLKTMIPTALMMGLLGYPFILPDMIGGNAYGEDFSNDVIMPDRELYIRWMQLTAYMSAMQFSISPWQYDNEVVLIGLKMVKVHEEIVTPLMIRLAKEATQTGDPLIRPVWWIAPTDETALTIDSEFLIGDDLLVAPVLEKGARVRDIYLPPGKWKDDLGIFESGVDGGKWLRDYKVELDQIATFSRVHEPGNSI
ncbi:myogenesis-regulating glycosidase-like [Saccoglossus kowalevskii]|uniref:Uncharacterized family 31 glucosidase KIAA1161-like n=1 Tax=Saccoglossus kowalevskii TaxID=10224 RepID=A0ABM0GUH4_SACKO|nr:PREDICTED: uncharacterized family 31 glucosidase KIAA1161-like [Saccoglossus kowalevskii]